MAMNNTYNQKHLPMATALNLRNHSAFPQYFNQRLQRWIEQLNVWKKTSDELKLFVLALNYTPRIFSRQGRPLYRLLKFVPRHIDRSSVGLEYGPPKRLTRLCFKWLCRGTETKPSRLYRLKCREINYDGVKDLNSAATTITSAIRRNPH